MKRQASPLSSGRERRRQDPVSCSFCRSKKLKCSREQPCSNCQSRGNACDFGPRKPASSDGFGPFDGYHDTERSPNDRVTADILARLQRLERAVLDNNSSNSLYSLSPAGGFEETGVVPSVSQNPIQSGAESASDQSFANAESTTTLDDAVGLAHADKINCGVKSIKELNAKVTLSEGPVQDGCIDGSLSITRHVWLPREDEALALFEEYVKSMGGVYHVLHFPTTRQLIRNIYQRFRHQEQVSSAHLALLLAIIATGSSFWNPGSTAYRDLFSGCVQSGEATIMWMKWALDAMENDRRTVFPSIEGLQATILATHLTANMEGFSSRARFLGSTALNMARDMLLHMTDSPRYRRKDERPKSYILLEVKRRLWWYIATTDWLISMLPGPQEGAYLIRLSHMCVNKPLNINDDDLFGDIEPQGAPMSQPTDMSYFLARCLGSELARVITDARPSLSSGSIFMSPSDYTKLIATVQDYTETLPSYFRSDRGDDADVKALHLKYPQLTMQRAILQLGLDLWTVRLHRPYMFQKSLPPPYTQSRELCLQAATRLINVRKSMDQMQSSLSLSRMRIAFIVHHIFTGVLVLAYDLCFNDFPSESAREHRRKQVREACKLFEDTGESSKLAARYLVPLKDTLRKHRIDVREPPPQQQQQQQQQSSLSRDEAGNNAQSSIDGDDNSLVGGLAIDASLEKQQPSFPLSEDDGGGSGSLQELTMSGDWLWNDILDLPSTFENTSDWNQLFADLDSTYTL